MDTARDHSQHGQWRPAPPPPSSSYAFLNHSPLTLPNNLPPTVDDKPLARQKRKRTSPEDQAILEAEYSRDPKPDKAARLELVSKVALGEKEVQIWFQNRRQSSRRKSRPLMLHEVAQYQLCRSESSPALSASLLSSSPEIHSRFARPQDKATFLADCGAEKKSSRLDENPAILVNPQIETEPQSQPTTLPLSPAEANRRADASIAAEQQSDPENSSIEGIPTPVAVSDDPRSAPIAPRQHHEYAATGGHATNDESNPAPSSNPVESKPGLKKSSSTIRLSMTSEGNAKITTRNAASPSPPRPTQPSHHLTGTVASKSTAIHGHGQPSITIPPPKPLQRNPSGRSRDSRAWEFWCDKDTRGELEEKAEKDGNTSAADAIGLLRSNSSGRKILGAVPVKRNAMMERHPALLKRSKTDDAQLRKHTSDTCLMRSRGLEQARGYGKPAKVKPIEPVYIPGNDSDKENWSPSSDGSGSDSRSDGATRGHPPTPAYYSMDPSMKGSRRTAIEPAAGTNASNPEADPEVAAFMRGGRASNRTSDEEDMDCVHGLLSLSQGNWR